MVFGSPCKGGMRQAAIGVGLVLLVAACKDEPGTSARTAPPEPISSAAAPTAAQRTWTVAGSGLASFLIDAPVEKIKGRSTGFRGSLHLDPGDLTATRGQVAVDLDDLKTETFGDPDKDARQTDHARNWLQLGSGVPAKQREENRWATFTITAVTSASPPRLADAPDTNGKRSVSIVADGNLWIHGVTSKKMVKLTAEFQGPPTSPTSVHVTSLEPLRVSLREHDVKPRDLAGAFLDGALEKIGQKIDDTVQLSITFDASP